jgi:hypothetical protein
MSLSSTAVFGNAAIAVTSISKCCSKVSGNLLLLQGLANIMDGSGFIADLSSGVGNSVVLLQSVANMVNYLDGRGWIDIEALTGNLVQVVIKLPYNTNLQSSALIDIFKFTLPSNLFKCGATTGDVAYSNVATGAPTGATWSVNSAVNLATISPSDYIADLIALQQGFENIADMMTALSIIGA